MIGVGLKLLREVGGIDLFDIAISTVKIGKGKGCGWLNVASSSGGLLYKH